MSTTIRISTPSDVPKVVRHVLGFEPTDSIVLLGLGSGPTARIDISPMTDMVDAYRPAVPQWKDGVLAVIYTADMPTDVADAVVRDLTARLGIPCIGSAVVSNGWVTAMGRTEPYNPDGRTRADIAADVDLAVHDADEADEEAETAYTAGNGALAWLYLDRARHLRGSQSQRGAALEAKLMNAVNPREC